MSWVAWITGRPGHEARALAADLGRALHARHEAVVILDADRCRHLLLPGPADADLERPDVVDRAIVHLAHLLADASIAVLLHGDGGREARDLARAVLPRFAAIHARRGGAEPGDDGGETGADVVVDVTDPAGALHATLQVLAALVPRAAVRRLSGSAAWAIWLTGMPGSGKTTLTDTVAEALDSRGVPVAIVDWPRLAQFATPGGPRSPRDADILRRTLLAAAILMTDAGVPVLVDATAPERVLREVARQHIVRFAEVQLLCDPAVAADRERAVRWGLTPCPQGCATCDVLEVVVDYEPARAPELTLHTDLIDVAAATAAIVQLAERLDGCAASSTTPREDTTMLVSDLMTRALITVGPETNVTEARTLMAKDRIRHLLVTDGPKLLGMVTDRDIRLNLASPATSLSVWELNFLLAKLTVAEVMTKSLLVVDPARDAREAARIMLDHRIGALPVLEGDRLVGILTETDLVRAFADSEIAAGVGR